MKKTEDTASGTETIEQPGDGNRKVDALVGGFMDFQGITLTEEKPQIITLCGSSRFCCEMAIIAWEFEKMGKIAMGLHLLPQGYCEQKGWEPDEHGKIHHIGELEGVEHSMDSLHFKKIEMSDVVFVVNIDGYIGSSTAREIDYAKHLGKEVRYLEEPNSSNVTGQPRRN